LSYQQPYRPSSFNILPPVVKNILILNGIMFLAMEVFKSRFNIDLNDLLGLHYPTSEKFHWYQFLTYMFMHANFPHILFNMFAVWTFGYVLENYWGPKRFIIFYVVTAVGAAATQLFYTAYQLHAIDMAIANANPESYLALMHRYYSGPGVMEVYDAWKNNVQSTPSAIDVAMRDMTEIRMSIINSPVVGASGALFGILLAFGMLFPNTELIMLFFPIPIKAKYMVMIYGGIELFSGVSQVQGDMIAHFAHLGGMLFGFILIKIWQKDRNHFY
jgi:membrane associated rhomboid family serine protease